jgi:hypothetical protein
MKVRGALVSLGKVQKVLLALQRPEPLKGTNRKSQGLTTRSEGRGRS